jgi:hypothetical protein
MKYIIKIDIDAPGGQMNNYCEAVAKLWCYKQFGYRTENNNRWDYRWEGRDYVFEFNDKLDATFFALKWGGQYELQDH